jgi:RND family efflux transporter MFP subunit
MTIHGPRLGLMLLWSAVLISAAAGCSDDKANQVPPDSVAANADTQHADEGEAEHDESETRVTLSETAHATADIKTEAVREGVILGSMGLTVPGQVEFDPRRVAVISPKTPGRIEQLLVVEGDRVVAGQTVARLFSPAFITGQSDLLQATTRAKRMAGTADEAGSAAMVNAARRRLTLLGATEPDLERLIQTGEPSDYLSLAAPFSGSIMEAEVLAGSAVEAGTAIFKIADLSVVDVIAEIPEQSIPSVRLGQAATIGIAAFPDLQFEGEVERLRDELNQETRTVRAVIHVPNRAGRLRPGMFATVQLAVTGSAPGNKLHTIPESAVVTDGEQRFVFVEVAPRTYERREVVLESLTLAGSSLPTTSRVGVREGLSAMDRVVVQGAFTLKSELAKAGLGEHGH